MKAKKVIRLINNERKKTITRSEKGCISDTCGQIDYAHCDVYSTDICNKNDYAACIIYSTDICIGNYDFTSCMNSTYDLT